MARTKLRIGRWVLGLVIAGLAFVLADAWSGLGSRATGERRARMERSPQWKDGAFENPQPLWNDFGGMMTGLFNASTYGRPAAKLPVEAVEAKRFEGFPQSGLRVTWLGHASMLIEMDGKRVLTDPMWSERSSPLSWVGPTRWFPPPLALDDLPPIDAVVISHDHYDHLDEASVRALDARGTKFFVPLGVGAHLEGWGVPLNHIVEMDWWEDAKVGDLTITCTPARHASGRAGWDKDATLWAGWALSGPKHRVYFSGDTGLFPAMKDIGEKLGPFDLTMIESGQYHQAWPDWHIGPEQAVVAHSWVRGQVMLPVHWGLLTLAYHGWTEPVERVVAAAERAGVRVLTPKPGQSVEPATSPPSERWWPSVPFETAAQSPIVSTQTGLP